MPKPSKARGSADSCFPNFWEAEAAPFKEATVRSPKASETATLRPRESRQNSDLRPEAQYWGPTRLRWSGMSGPYGSLLCVFGNSSRPFPMRGPASLCTVAMQASAAQEDTKTSGPPDLRASAPSQKPKLALRTPLRTKRVKPRPSRHLCQPWIHPIETCPSNLVF